MFANTSSPRNISLITSLQKTLQDALIETSFETSNVTSRSAAQEQLNLLHQQNVRRPTASPLSLLTSNMTKSSRGLLASSAAIPERRIFGLRLTSEDLLVRTAAIERQVLNHRAAAIRQQALAGERMERKGYNESLLQLMHGSPSAGHGFGNQFLPQMMKIHDTARKGTNEAMKDMGTCAVAKKVPFIDSSPLNDADAKDISLKKTRGGVTEPFPEKLHRMLTEVEEDGKTDIISFLADGRAFAVHDIDRFMSEIMPKYFKQSKFSSFQRQLNLYGFTRINSGPDAGGYYHQLFLKERSNLCLRMRRVGITSGKTRRKI